MYTESELRMIGLEALEQKLGAVDAQRFLVSMMRNAGDYTFSRRRAFDDISIEDVRRNPSIARSILSAKRPASAPMRTRPVVSKFTGQSETIEFILTSQRITVMQDPEHPDHFGSVFSSVRSVAIGASQTHG